MATWSWTQWSRLYVKKSIYRHEKKSYFILRQHIICMVTWSWQYVFNINGINVYKTLKLVSGPHNICMPTWPWWHATYAFLKSETHFIFDLCLPDPECIYMKKNSIYVKIHISFQDIYHFMATFPWQQNINICGIKVYQMLTLISGPHIICMTIWT